MKKYIRKYKMSIITCPLNIMRKLNYKIKHLQTNFSRVSFNNIKIGTLASASVSVKAAKRSGSDP